MAKGVPADIADAQPFRHGLMNIRMIVIGQ